MISAKLIMHLPEEIWTGILSSNEYVFDSSFSSENRYTSTMQGIPCASIHSKKALHSIKVIC